MALVKCPECGKEISSQATVCPKCGCRIALLKPSKAPAWIKALNIISIVFGSLMAFAVTGSEGGILGNPAPTIIGCFLIAGGALFLVALGKMNKIITITSVALYLIAFLCAADSIDIRISYLILEFIIGVIMLTDLLFMKKNHVLGK